MRAIYEAGGRLELAVTLGDDIAPNKSGRVYLDEFCESHDIPLVKTRHVNDDVVLDAIAQHRIDWLFIVGWSQIAGPRVLEAPTRGCIGIHPTLLPVGRGRAPIPWAIIKGLDETGVTMFALDEGVDTGPVIAQERLSIAPDETATSLYARVSRAHDDLIRKNWQDLVEDRLVPVPQDDDRATEWPGRKPEDGRISATMSVDEVDRLVRGVTRPYPGAFTEIEGRTLRIWAGRTTPGAAVDSTGSIQRVELRDGTYYAEEWEWED
jgi:methionyl-tRNA formyltransferase